MADGIVFLILSRIASGLNFAPYLAGEIPLIEQ
jgi:hypothetical protein